jgi:uncharacterized protein YkwD
MILTVLPAATMAGSGTAPTVIKQTEWKVLGQMNRVRARHGLKPLRMAMRVRLTARDRSRDMRNRNYFDHESPTGLNAARMMNRRGVNYSLWSENIAWTGHVSLAGSADDIVRAWMGSAGHRRTLLSRDFNYVGVGLARSGNQTWYTTVFVRQRDHTAPIAGMRAVETGLAVSSGSAGARPVTVRWWGRDKVLQLNTAGIRSFKVQYRPVGGKWRVVRRGTRAHSLTMTLAEGQHQFRVRAVDRNGNVGKWKRPLTVTVH